MTTCGEREFGGDGQHAQGKSEWSRRRQQARGFSESEPGASATCIPVELERVPAVRPVAGPAGRAKKWAGSVELGRRPVARGVTAARGRHVTRAHLGRPC
jgi:hypothetical protein